MLYIEIDKKKNWQTVCFWPPISEIAFVHLK